MKYIKSALVLLLLVGLPLGSWYFLNSGLEWRKEKVVNLKQKESFLSAFDFSVEDKNRLYETMVHRTNVIKRQGGLTANDSTIIDQFEDAYTFQFISLDRNEEPTDGAWVNKSILSYYKPSSMESLVSDVDDWNYILVDTSGYIRQFYLGESKQVMKLLVEDIAVILPRKKAKDIVIKQSSKEN